MDLFEVLRCNGCFELANPYSNSYSINSPHERCPMGGVLKRDADLADLQQASFYSNSQVSTAPTRITNIAPETPSNLRNDHTKSDRRPSGDGQGQDSNRGRGRGRGRGAAVTTRDGPFGRGTDSSGRDSLVTHRTQPSDRDGPGGHRIQPSRRDGMVGRGTQPSGRGSLADRVTQTSARGSLADHVIQPSRRDGLVGRITQPSRQRSRSPNRSNAIDYRDRSARSPYKDPRDGGWLPNGSAYVYDEVSLHPTSWHKFRLDNPRSTMMEKYWDSWRYYRSRGHGHKIPKALEMPHIMPPHPIYGPKYEAELGRRTNLLTTTTSKTDGSKGGKDNTKQAVAMALMAPDNTYCLSCQSHFHSFAECDATRQTLFWVFPFFDEQLPVDMARFQSESKYIAPSILATLIEHLFAIRSVLQKSVEWCVRRNARQLAIWKEFKKIEEIESRDSSKSQDMMRRIVQVDLIYDKMRRCVNKTIKTFDAFWLGQCKKDGLAMKELTPVGVKLETNEQMVTRFYTTAQSKDWPFPGLEAAAKAMRDEVRRHIEECCVGISSWNRNILNHIQSLGEDAANVLDAAEHACYSALTDERAHLKVDHSAWLDLLLIPDVPDEAFEQLLSWRVFHANFERLTLTPGVEGAYGA